MQKYSVSLSHGSSLKTSIITNEGKGWGEDKDWLLPQGSVKKDEDLNQDTKIKTREEKRGLKTVR